MDHKICTKIFKFLNQCTEVRFASLLSGGFTTMAVINPPESKLAKRTYVHLFEIQQIYLCNIHCDETKSESWHVRVLVSVLPE